MAFKLMHDGDPKALGKRASQLQGLIESPLAHFAWVQGDREQGIDVRYMLFDVLGQGSGQNRHQ
jgi:hypothetical protein